MCGLAGFLVERGPADAVRGRLGAMLDSLVHRGPDGEGAFIDTEGGIALGHRRLAIIDLSPAGRQPMESADGRWVISFVGEIYNHQDLRRDLEAAGIRFRGQSDTEVLLESLAHWGVEATLARLNGIFSIAAWDRQERQLLLARDQIGVKPLYWGWLDGHLLFASELKAIRAASDRRPEINRDALAGLLRLGYITGPDSIYRGIGQLPPGWMGLFAPGREQPLALRPYWSLAEQAARTAPMGEDEAVEALTAAITTAVRRQMMSDVPLGAFLSGGLDSSTVVAAMRAAASGVLRTFTIGFEGGGDERPAAAAIARHLDTTHTDLLLTERDALDLVPTLPALYDEPLADPSQIPTLLLSRLTRRHVTVALSGDGGDELFAGYPRYAMTEALWRKAGRLPPGLRRFAGAALAAIPAPLLHRLGPLLPRRLWRRSPLDTVRAAGALLRADGPDMAYHGALAVWPRPEDIVIGARAADLSALPGADRPFADRMRLHDMTGYLPDDILAKVDRASMACSLEVRVPLLDREVVELCWRLPPGLVDPRRPKHLLRRVQAKLLPPGLVPGGKSGFSPPISAWLRGPLRPWAEDLLSPACLVRDGLFHPAPVRQAWTEHLSGRQDHAQRLWTVLTATAWQRHWLDGAS